MTCSVLVCWGALTNFPCELRLKNFSALGVQVHPTAPPGYAYGRGVFIWDGSVCFIREQRW